MRWLTQLPVYCLLALLLVAGPLVARERGRLSLNKDGGYTDLVVAIDRSLPEDAKLIDKIKAVLQEFSSQLAVATEPMFNNGASLRLARVFILLPKTWTNATDQIASSTWQTYENAEIRLGNSPGAPHYTYHGGNCATLGDYIVFDTSHVTKSEDYWLGKQMLSEFGRFRWGLRSEHNGDKGPHFYLQGSRIVPAVCNEGINGSFRHNETQQPCKFNSNTLEPEPQCRFYPDSDQVVEASLLTTTSVRNIKHFCSAWHSASSTTRHNKRAPVPLNHKSCGAHSARHLMLNSESGDFLTAPTLNPTPPPALNVIVVRPLPYRRLVIIIDVSTSMSGDPINKIKVGLESFISDMLEDGIECAVVTFNSVANVVKPLDFLATEQKRLEYANAVRGLVAGGFTAIGEGLVLGMRLLGENPWIPYGNIPGYMLLLSDGDENRHTNFTLPQAAEALKKTSIIVDTVSFGQSADKRLTQLSKDTNGLSFFCRFENSTNDFLEQLSETVRQRVESTAKPIDIFSAPISQTFSIPITIDPSVGRDTNFLLSTYRAADIRSMDMRVVSPNGTVYDKTSPLYVKDATQGTVTIRMKGQIESGTWTVTDGDSTMRQPAWSNAEVFNTRAALTVSSKSTSQEEPVILDGSVLGETEIIRLNRSTEVVIRASLQRGAQLLLGARILAKVESESNVEAVLELQDKGVYPDVEASDGMYTALVPLRSIMKPVEYNLRLICESPVDRVTSAGKIYVKSVDSGSLRDLPPASVQDLRVSVDLATESLRLYWTAVGDEQNDGTAAQYIIKSSANDTLIQEQFYSADNVSVSATPLPAGSLQSVNISSSQLFDYNGTTFYLAVQAVSSKGVTSPVSNLVATQLTVPDNVEIIDGVTTLIPSTLIPSTTRIPDVLTTTKAGSKHMLSLTGVAGCLIMALYSLTGTV